jgi:cytochrome c556
VSPLFPAGSNQHPSEASEKIWRDFADFEKRAKAAAEAARQLADADPGDATLVAARFRALTKACGGCHETYRVKR